MGIVSQVMEGETSVKNKLMLDKDIQTPVHFVERNFDPNYFWNEWELRKKAIQMANIRKNQTKVTHTMKLGLPDHTIEFPGGLRYPDLPQERRGDEYNGRSRGTVSGREGDEEAQDRRLIRLGQ